MRLSRRGAICGVIACVVTSMAAMGCNGDKGDAKSADSSLEPWEGQLRELFNDQIHPGAVGLSMDAQSPARDPLLRLRTTNADVAARMTVQTVNLYSVGAKTTYTLKLTVLPPPFKEPALVRDHFELVIKQDSPVFGMVQSLGDSLKEKKFIGFMRKFPGPDGAEIHWHLTKDSEEVAEVVREAAVLDEIKGNEP